MALGSLVGVGFAVLAAVGLAVQSLAVRLGTRTHSITDVIAVMFAANLVVLVPVAGVLAYPAYDVTFVAILAFTAAGILGSLLARVCYFVGIARIGASRTEPLKATFPLFAVAIAVFALGERVTWRLAGAAALVVVGVVFVVQG
jgi:drug/metabolite transporter (DMT)-like permease